jgi:SAM-dependent methyltransferase
MTGPACRNCGNPNLETVLDFGDMPLANALLTSDQLDAAEPRYPLALAFCSTCYLAQITHVVAPELLFRDYAYFSSVSDAMVEHARQLVARVAGSRNLGPASLVVEIASNDGYLLQHYVNRGIPVLGIDPARNIAEAATARGIPTLAEFFGVEVAESLRADGRTADVVHANNVLAHAPDIHGFLAGIATILKPGGIAVFETPYVRDLVDRLEFDTIYHEHVFYYSLSSIVELMSRHGLVVVDVERLAIHGGSLRVTVAHDEAGGAGVAPVTPAPAVAQLLAEEERIGLRSVESFRGFADRVHALGDELTATLAGLKAEGTSIAAYGAAAKGAVLLNAFGIDAGTIDFVADRSPHKAGRFMPGVRIPVVSADRLGEVRPDVCLLLTWNFADEILEQQAAYRAAGGRFLIPVPELRWA